MRRWAAWWEWAKLPALMLWFLLVIVPTVALITWLVGPDGLERDDR